LGGENVDLWEIFFKAHQGSWGVLVVLYLISYIFSKQKITHMILRLFYVIMLVSGIGMLALGALQTVFIVKLVIAVLAIGLMEMTILRKRRNEPTGAFFILLIVLVAVLVSIGYGYIRF
jgi:hypothetical protein